MQHTPLVEVTRGIDAKQTVECIHYGSVAVVDQEGKLLYDAGDPEFLTFTRSTLKPFQALPFLRDDGPAKWGFDSADVAMLAASHSGEEFHSQRVASMLAKIGCDEHHLQCGCHVPMRYSAFDKPAPPDLAFNQLHNNCSGKHAGFLAYCRQHDLPLENYLDFNHPLQVRVREQVAAFSGISERAMPAGIDGCSAPNYALPLSRLAASYARLAQGERDAEYGASLGDLFGAMTTHPELISGTGRNDLAFMQTAPGDWVAKIGADGVQTIGVRSAGLGIAIKIADGNMRALYTAAVEVLRQLGLVSDPSNTPLAPWVHPILRNFRDLETGEVRAVLKLHKC